MTDTSQKEKTVIDESSLLLMDEHATKAKFDSFSISFGSEDGSVACAPSGIYEPSIEAMDTERSAAAQHSPRTPAHRYERLKRGEIIVIIV